MLNEIQREEVAAVQYSLDQLDRNLIAFREFIKFAAALPACLESNVLKGRIEHKIDLMNDLVDEANEIAEQAEEEAKKPDFLKSILDLPPIPGVHVVQGDDLLAQILGLNFKPKANGQSPCVCPTSCG